MTDGAGAKVLAKLRAVRDSTLRLTEAALVMAIILRENGRTGTTWASVETLAADAHLGLRVARRDLAKLIQLGVVERARRKHKSSLLSVSLSVLRALRRGDRLPETVRDVHNELSETVHQVHRESAPRAQSDVHHVHPNSLNDELTLELPTTGAERDAARTLWDGVLRSLRSRMNPQMFDTWIKPTRGLCVRDGVLIVGVPNHIFVRWLESDGAAHILPALREHDPGIGVEYRAREMTA